MNLQQQIIVNNAKQTAERLIDTYGIDVPDQLADALAVHQAVLAEEPDAPDLAAEAHTLTIDTVPEVLARATDARLRSTIGGEVKTELAKFTASRVAQALTVHADAIVELLRPRWDAELEGFMENYNRLPSDWRNADALIKRGAEAVNNHNKAALHAEALTALANTRALLGIEQIGLVATGLEYADATDTVEAEALAKAGKVKAGPLDPWASLLENGATRLVWRTHPQWRQAIRGCRKAAMQWKRDKHDESGMNPHKQVKVLQ